MRTAPMNEPISLFGLDDPELERKIRRKARRRTHRIWRFGAVMWLLGLLVGGSIVLTICKITITAKLGGGYWDVIFGVAYASLVTPIVLKRMTGLENAEVRRILARLRRCTNCGYSLRRLVADCCPECGATRSPGGSAMRS